MLHLSKSIPETKRAAQKALALLAAGKQNNTATVLVCSGDLGAGKTTFTKALASLLGIKEKVVSPTFVLEKIYKISERARRRFGFSRLVHIDAYRMDRPEELEALRFKEIAGDHENLVVIEWGEKIKRALPKSYKQIHFLFVDEKTRQISLVK